jgi:hypothetical protein
MGAIEVLNLVFYILFSTFSVIVSIDAVVLAVSLSVCVSTGRFSELILVSLAFVSVFLFDDSLHEIVATAIVAVPMMENIKFFILMILNNNV